jgi:hypothetical protein
VWIGRSLKIPYVCDNVRWHNTWHEMKALTGKWQWHCDIVLGYYWFYLQASTVIQQWSDMGEEYIQCGHNGWLTFKSGWSGTVWDVIKLFRTVCIKIYELFLEFSTDNWKRLEMIIFASATVRFYNFIHIDPLPFLLNLSLFYGCLIFLVILEVHMKILYIYTHICCLC